MPDSLQAIVALLDQHFYLLVLTAFVLSAAESVVLVGALVPGTALLLALGAGAAIWDLPLWPIVAAAITGAIAGDGLSYGIGRWKGDRLLSWASDGRMHQLVERGQDFMERHGGKSVFFARFVPGVRAIVPVAAGISGLAPGRFFAANVASAFIWAPAHILIAAAAGHQISLAGPEAERIAILIGVVFGVIVLSITALQILLFRVIPWLNGLRRRAAMALRDGDASKSRSAVLALLEPDGGLRTLIILAVPLGFFAWAFGALADEVLEQGELMRFDQAVSLFFTDLRTTASNHVMVVITAFGDFTAMLAATVALALAFVATRQPKLGLGAAAIMGIAGAVSAGLKAMFAIPRPTDLYEGAQAFSFPSSHATSAATLFALLAWIAWAGLSEPWRHRLPAIFAGMAGLIAASRLYLAAHWPSDIAGGLLLGAGLVTLFGIAFRHQPPKRAGLVLAIAICAFSAVGTWHAVSTMSEAMIRYELIAPGKA